MLTSCFIREFGIFPTGVFVRLANGEIGVVSGRGTAPIAHALLDADGLALRAPIRRDTTDPQYAVRNMLSGEQVGIRVDMVSVWGGGAQA